MQPDVAGLFGAERQPRVVGAFASISAGTTAGRRAHRIAVQPLGYAAGEGAGLGFRARQTAIELGDAGVLVEERLPVLGRPAVIRWGRDSWSRIVAGGGAEASSTRSSPSRRASVLPARDLASR